MKASEDDPPLGFLLVRIAEAIDKEFVGTLAGLGLKPRELRLLVVIDRGDGLTQRQLARSVGVDTGNLVAVLEDLEARELLARPRDAQDRRRRMVRLTAKGQRLLGRARRATGAIEDELLADLTAAERRAFYDTASRVWRAM